MTDGVHVRREHNAAPPFRCGSKPGQYVVPTGKDGLSLDLQSGTRCNGDKMVRHAVLTGARVIHRHEGRIHAGQRDQIAKKLFGRTHQAQFAPE